MDELIMDFVFVIMFRVKVLLSIKAKSEIPSLNKSKVQQVEKSANSKDEKLSFLENRETTNSFPYSERTASLGIF